MKKARIFFSIILIISLFILLNPKAAFAAYTCTGGGDHGGATWDPATDCPGGIAGVHTNIGALTINSGETATVYAYNGTTYGTVDITATSIDIEGTLTAAGKGYTGGNGYGAASGPGAGLSGNGSGSGAGYGGVGGSASVGSGGTSYGSYTAPNQMGSGGGGNGNCCGTGGNGGGYIKLTTTGTFTINGTLTADGAAGTGTNAGGGSGGSIYASVGSIAGSGTVTASGGAASSASGGAGAGGRIAIYYTGTNGYTGTLGGLVNPGGTGNSADQGTAILVDSTNNDLYINSNQKWNSNPTFEGAVDSVNYHNITVQNNATWYIKGYYTTGTNGVGITLNATNNFTVATGATLTASALGYAGGAAGYNNGTGPGGGAYGNGSAGGGGYGSNGATSSGGAAAGAEYGSYSQPTALGSGGGGQGNYGSAAGGNGGGAIKINNSGSGTFTINGTISADGGTGGTNAGGGGSGGSIYILAGNISGNGSITAKGGAAGANGAAPGTAGSGAGGRIAIYYTGTNGYTGTLSATVTGGTSGVAANPGTSILVDSTNNDLYLNTTQYLNSNPSYEGAISNTTYHNITIQNSSTVTAIGYYTTNSNGVGITFNLTNNFTIASGSSLTASGVGYAGGNGYGAASGPGAGLSGNGSGSGGGYGGAGGASYQSGGSTYGSSSAPVSLGSGGGGNGNCCGVGGYGGGAIEVSDSSGTVSIVGNLTADGAAGTGTNAGGGSGGSIYIISYNFSATGTISAVGGNASGSSAGSGGGGRIAIYYANSKNYSGTPACTGGTVGHSGTSGTYTTARESFSYGYTTLTAIVPTNISFSMSTSSLSLPSAGGNMTVSSGSANLSGNVTLNISTNAANGFAVTVQDAHNGLYNSTYGATIPSVSGGPINLTSKGFGMGANTSASYGSIASRFATSGTTYVGQLSTTATTCWSGTASGSGSATFYFNSYIDGSVTAGQYGDTVTYIVTGTF